MDENTETMLELWAQGLSDKQIAMHLGVSKNAIAGKLHRMNLAGKVPLEYLSRRNEVCKRRPPRETAKPEPLPLPASTPQPPPQEACEIIDLFANKDPGKGADRPIRLEKLTPRSCRYVVSGDKAADYLFCGKVKAKGSYCEEHARICYSPLVRIGTSP
jgi:GcrA cell cycle regulator